MPGVGKKADAVADRSGVPLLYNHACLYRSLPPGGKGVPPFPDLKYSAPAPCRSGSKGEAPWSPKAKSPERCGEGLEFLGDEPEKFGEGA